MADSCGSVDIQVSKRYYLSNVTSLCVLDHWGRTYFPITVKTTVSEEKCVMSNSCSYNMSFFQYC